MERYEVMCFWNEDIQSHWKPKAGDKTIWNVSGVYHTITHKDFKGFYKELGEHDTPEWHTWLPTQEDLQKIALEKLHYGELELIDLFTDWCKEHLWAYSYWHDTTITELWMHFVMVKCFKKVWQFEKEVWEG